MSTSSTKYGGSGGTPPKGGPAGKVEINTPPSSSGGKPPSPPKGTSAHYGDYNKK